MTRFSKAFPSDDERWDALRARAADAESAFVYAVRTTGVFCRPTCRSRLPLRRNVRFFDSPRQAELAGFRACRRCHPSGTPVEPKHRSLVLHACRTIESANDAPSLRDLADDAGVSPFHFQRVFKQHVGVSPKQYALAVRSNRFRKNLRQKKSVTEAIYVAGYQSHSRAYEPGSQRLGMDPSTYQKGAPGMTIDYAITTCDLGQLLVAATDRGVCSIAFADDAASLHRDLQDEFPRARCTVNRAAVQQFVEPVLKFLKRPTKNLQLPLDIQGTAFQQRVWQALRQITPGQSRTYREIAEELDAPRSVRAVAQACAKNRLALAIPCHRVVRADARASGYRWGIERKQQLLEREQQA